jgi:predicted DNA-binding transcriptional regulator YafY
MVIILVDFFVKISIIKHTFFIFEQEDRDMPKFPDQKLRMMLILKILQEETDREHTISITELADRLKSYKIKFERKAIYSDFEVFREAGLSIGQTKGHRFGYYWDNHVLELAELKILIDAVQSFRFLTGRKTRQMINKLKYLAGPYDTLRLEEQVREKGRVKAQNEQVFMAIPRLFDAIADNKQVSFKYFEYTLTKTLRHRRNGHVYTVSPYALHQDNDYYYLICHNPERGIVHFRVDKIAEIEVLEDDSKPLPEDFDLVTYTQQMISMYGGELETVTIEFANDLIGVVIDRFGTDIDLARVDENHFSTKLQVGISPTFFSCLFLFGDQAKITAPEHVVDQVRNQVKELCELYD